jgi:hypothetical protein
MAHTTIANLAHAPVELLLEAIHEAQARINSIWNSPLILQDPRNFANRALEDGATNVQMPLIKPIGGTYTLQNPGTPPTPDNISSVRQNAAVVYREKAWGADAFSRAQSGIDPFAYIANRILQVRFDAAEDMFINIVGGMFASTAFAGNIFATGFADSAVAEVYFDQDIFHDMTGLLGVKEDAFIGGTILMHSKVRTNLKKLNELDTVKPSEGQGIEFQTYKGLRVVCDDRLVRNAASGPSKVYSVTICAPQTILFNIATQSQDGTTSSSLAYDSDVPNLRKALYDRVVMLCHVNGTIWSPQNGGALTIATAGPTDAQFVTANKWLSAYNNPLETRVVRSYVNG